MNNNDNPSAPYLFVVGCPRSGTTLLQRMLDAHPQMAVANDSHFIPRAVEKVGLDAGQRLTPELVSFVRHYRRFYRLGISQETVDLAASQHQTYPHFVAALYTEFAKSKGKLLGAEKTPDYVKKIPLLHELFPRARFIHIIRDGREVALSAMEWASQDKGPGRFALWQHHPLAVCALWWAMQVTCGMQDGRALGQSLYLEIHYADLVSEPEKTLRRITKFLDLPYANSMPQYYLGKTRMGSERSVKSAWLPPITGLRDFQSELNPRQLALFEVLAGDVLDSLDYALVAKSATESIKKEARLCRRWWQDRQISKNYLSKQEAFRPSSVEEA